MSSLLQFNGKVSRKGVQLEFTKGGYFRHYERLSDKDGNNDMYVHGAQYIAHEPVVCTICGQIHEQLYVAWRKPRGMFGCWVVFAYNGEKHVPDLSIPIDVDRIPKDARKLSVEENAAYWHRN